MHKLLKVKGLSVNLVCSVFINLRMQLKPPLHPHSAPLFEKPCIKPTQHANDSAVVRGAKPEVQQETRITKLHNDTRINQHHPQTLTV